MISAQVVTSATLGLVDDARVTGPMETVLYHTTGKVYSQDSDVGYDLESEELDGGSALDTSDEAHEAEENHVVTVFPVAPGSLPRGPIKPPTRGGSGVEIKSQSQKLLEKRQADVKKKGEETKSKNDKKNEKR